MTTISAKELRLNLKETLKRVSEGEEIIIIYKSKPVAKLCTVDSGSNAMLVNERLTEYLANSKGTSYSKKKYFDYKDELYKDMKKKYKH
ncbi:MAG: type II toxin-antitoxin system Phd/YefM family antitoxin [Candidatus Dojkabacteria bacterium]